jgi:hypothetical protein
MSLGPAGSKKPQEPDQWKKIIPRRVIILPSPNDPGGETEHTKWNGNEQIQVVIPQRTGQGEAQSREKGQQEKKVLSPRHWIWIYHMNI